MQTTFLILIIRTYPDGLDVEFFKTECLLKADIFSNNAVMREHITPYLSKRKPFINL